MTKPKDQEKREKALDPENSFIVQAPAGSGKTELLTQRFLRLLSIVDRPEEILAITFTKKAAAEMANRILQALGKAKAGIEPKKPHQKVTWHLSKEALKRDKECNWDLLNNPSRLKIQTIDSFCLYLTRQMPLYSQFGQAPEILQDPESLYEEAVQETLLELGKKSPYSSHVSELLAYFDNDWFKLQSLLKDMLKTREHWMEYAAGFENNDQVKNSLEGWLKEEIQRKLKAAEAALQDSLSISQKNALFDLLGYAAGNLKLTKPDSLIIDCAGLSWLPGTNLEELSYWHGIREFLLTQSGSWRKKVDKGIGFKAKKDCKKDEIHLKPQMEELLAQLRDLPELEAVLADLGLMPDSAFSDKQWKVLDILLNVLKLGLANLLLVMQRREAVDYSEVSLRALQALGSDEKPTDLLLKLDYRIGHLLIDEFQDVNLRQLELLRRLSAGWTPGDGKTMFAVGDPMQSIYRFRKADVGIFMQAREMGIGQIKLNNLELAENFRSSQEVVNWVNQVFPKIFQKQEDPVKGAVKYSEMQSQKSKDKRHFVQVHPLVKGRTESEPELVLRLIQEALAQDPTQSIALLVRNRKHLEEILQVVKKQGLNFQAVEIESLSQRQVVLDLLCLTKALLNLADRLAWLAVIRAPWCGLDLGELYLLVKDKEEDCIWECLQDEEQLEGLGAGSKERLFAFKKIMQNALENLYRLPLHRLVERVWLNLGGPACLQEEQELDDAKAFFRHLQAKEKFNTLEDLDEFERSLESLYASPGRSEEESGLQIMTIHKAKGLEFDTVILPGLHKKGKGDERPMLQVLEVPAEDSQSRSRLFLAPMEAPGEEKNNIYEYIRKINKEQEENELVRLFYVAVTRAKKCLHLVGEAQLKDQESEELVSPKKNTLLSLIWPGVKAEFEERVRGEDLFEEIEAENGNLPKREHLFRIDRHWSLPKDLPSSVPIAPAPSSVFEEMEEVVFDWAGERIRQLGIAVHRLLKIVSEQGKEYWQNARHSPAKNSFILNLLFQAGLSSDEASKGLETVFQALENTLADPVGSWILERHSQEHNEYAISGFVGNSLVNGVFDRTFVDDKGIRWILDYKTSLHKGGGLEDFLDQEEERYREQLHLYARLMKNQEERKQRLGLYFPLLQAWREVQL